MRAQPKKQDSSSSSRATGLGLIFFGIVSVCVLGYFVAFSDSAIASSSSIKYSATHPGRAGQILITGGSGFIGSNLADYLLEQNYDVVIFNRNGLKVEEHKKHPHILYVAGDIRDRAALDKLPKTITGIVHLAAAISVAESMTDPTKYETTNVKGSENVFQWAIANGVKKVVSASSAAVYGNPEVLPCVEYMSYAGISPYADTKYKMEVIQEKMFEAHGLEGAALRFFNVYGPRQDPKSPYSGVISKFLDCANDKTAITIFGDGKATRDFIFVKDIARAILIVLEKGTGFNVYNVGTGRVTSIQQLAEAVKKVAHADSSAIKLTAAREGDIVHSLSSPQKLKDHHGFEAKVLLADGLAITQEWFAKEKQATKA